MFDFFEAFRHLVDAEAWVSHVRVIVL